MKLDDLSLSKKLWASIIALLTAMMAVGLWGQYSSALAQRQAAERTQRAQELVTVATYWKALTQTNIERRMVTMVSTDPALAKLFTERLVAGKGISGDLQKRIQDLATNDEDKKAFEVIAKTRAELNVMGDRLVALKKGNDQEAVLALLNKEYMKAATDYDAAQGALVALQQTQRDAIARQAEEAQQRTAVIGWLAIGIVFALGLAWAAVLVRSINLPIKRAVTLAEAIAEGDLSRTIDEHPADELGRLTRAMSTMGQRLRALVSEVRQGVGSVSVASAEIAGGNQDLSSRTEQTASNLQETVSSLEQLTQTVTQSADVARQANALAASAADAAARGGEVVAQVVASMEQISGSSKKIADIIGVIDGIAFQTNILALNAAVEAARAGEQGRGFAVVASEVRSLAQRSAKAAKEIKSLIGSSVETVQSGSQQVDQARQVMGEVVSSVRRVSGLIGEMTTAAGEQRDGITQVSQAVDAIDRMTQQNAALVEESTAAASSLRDQAERLTQTVAVFNIGMTSTA